MPRDGKSKSRSFISSGPSAAPAARCAASPPDLARQEAWALLLIHNITATAAARAAGTAGIDPGLIPFTAVLGLIRPHVAAEARCQHCGHRPDDPLASLNAAILALPRHRPSASEPQEEPRPNAGSGIPRKSPTPSSITKSNLPKWDTTPKT
jgi:hypothetical protein